MSSIRDLGRKLSRTDDDSGLGQYTLAGSSVICPHCKGVDFKINEAQLNTALATLLNLDWTNRSASILICASCGQIQWFEKPPSKVT